MVLLPAVKTMNIPVRIILSGVRNGDAINIDYIKLARATKGSIHTRDMDYYDLKKNNLGENFKVGDQLFSVESESRLLLNRD